MQKPMPAIAVIVDEPLQHSCCRSFRSPNSNRNLAEERRDSRKFRHFSEKSTDFHIRIFFGLQSSVQLEKQLPSEQHCGVRLLDRSDAGGQIFQLERRRKLG